MATTQERAAAKKLVAELNGLLNRDTFLREKEVLDTFVKEWYGPRSLDRVKFCRWIWSHAEENIWKERWRRLRSKFDW